MPDQLLTPREVAEELGVTVRTVQRWIADGRLPAQRVGGRLRLSRSSLAGVTTAQPEPAGHAIRRLLIANRGEIAVRIARTARALGIRTVGVHAADERWPEGIDDAHPISSYLDGDDLLAVARRAGADAVHPGYGFLAENADFARATAAAGLIWVGPPAEAMAAMGDKAAARQRAAEQGVAVVPGYDGEAQDDATLLAETQRIGLPLLVKPSAGGGGKGMRVVRSIDALPEALAAARREAHRSFGDDRLILERHLAHPRHVEVQVLFDRHGNGVHLGERDCSSQRRNQKIVEEAPAPSVSAELRERMGAAALAVARAVGYTSAGTVEFLLTDAGEFFFLEMNTRLQVEHPVTELVTGRDLVADQLRIASGEPLGFGQGQVRLRGHAVEARLYAEDPEAGFLPASGRLLRLVWPDGIRIDAGVRKGDEVGDRYDPLLAKLIAHGRDRAAALASLRAALDRTLVLGTRTNLRFLRWLLDQPTMGDGAMRTDTLVGMDLPGPPGIPDAAWRAAANALGAGQAGDPWSGGWRLNASAVLRLRSGDEERNVSAVADDGHAADATLVVAESTAYVEVEGQSVEVTVAAPPTVEEAVRHAAAHGEGSALLSAPMPGRVIAVRAIEGATVAAHQPIVVLEAMKMEHVVLAPIDGTLIRVAVSSGQQVRRGDLLAEVLPAG